MKKITTFLLAVIIFAPSLSFAQYTNAVRLKIEGNGYSDETIIRLLNDASPEFDAYYDAYKMISPNPAVPSIYSKLPCNSDLSINSLPLYNKDTAIEIHTIIPVAGYYLITLEEVFPVDVSYNFDLKELNSGANINLNSTTTMELYLEPNSSSNLTFLFEISKTLTTSFSELNESSNEVVLTKGNGIFELLFKNEPKNNLMVFDVTGKKVFENTTNSNQIKIDLSSHPRGIYFIKTELFTHKILR